MRYQYECKKCKTIQTIDKPMSVSSREEKCEKCNSTLIRIFNTASISTGDGFKS